MNSKDNKAQIEALEQATKNALQHLHNTEARIMQSLRVTEFISDELQKDLQDAHDDLNRILAERRKLALGE